MTQRTCTIDGCDRAYLALGYCSVHYRRFKRHGDPLVSLVRREHQALSVDEAFRSLCGEPTATGCIEWQGAISAGGYGQMVRDGVKHYTHRYAYEQEHGPIPDGHVVRHTCDNKPCVARDHLLTGTDHDNAMDAYERLRHKRGTEHHAAKMDADSVRTLRGLRDQGMTYQALADRFGLSYVQARAISRREAWRHVA